MTIEKRTAIIALALTLTSGIATGCGYDCVAQCEGATARTIAQQGYNPDTGETGGMDEDTVCDIPEIQEASDCQACYEAFADVYRL